MNTRLILLIGVLASVSLAGCEGANDGGNGNMNPTPPVAAQTVSALVGQEITQNTADDAVPIEINDLPVSDEDTDDTSSPNPVN